MNTDLNTITNIDVITYPDRSGQTKLVLTDILRPTRQFATHLSVDQLEHLIKVLVDAHPSITLGDGYGRLQEGDIDDVGIRTGMVVSQQVAHILHAKSFDDMQKNTNMLRRILAKHEAAAADLIILALQVVWRKHAAPHLSYVLDKAVIEADPDNMRIVFKETEGQTNISVPLNMATAMTLYAALVNVVPEIRPSLRRILVNVDERANGQQPMEQLSLFSEHQLPAPVDDESEAAWDDVPHIRPELLELLEDAMEDGALDVYQYLTHHPEDSIPVAMAATLALQCMQQIIDEHGIRLPALSDMV